MTTRCLAVTASGSILLESVAD